MEIIDKNKEEKVIPSYSDIVGSVTVSTSRTNLNKVKSYLRKAYKFGERENFYILSEKLSIELGITLSLARRTLEMLGAEEFLEIIILNDGSKIVEFKMV